MGIQQGVNAISAGVLGAVVAGKHLKQQEAAVKGAEIRELAGIDREIANKQDETYKTVDEYLDADEKAQKYSEDVFKTKNELKKKLNDKRLSRYGEKYRSYKSALFNIETNEEALEDAREAALKRSQSAEHELYIYQNRKAELEAKYGKYKW